MEIRRLEEREQEVLAKLRSKPRLEGQHLTDAIYCNVKAWGLARLAMAGEEIVRFDDGTLLRFLTGLGMERILSEGEMSQLQTISEADDSVGTIDIWMGTYPVEIKVTWQSSRKDVGENDHWLLQLGGYAARNLRDGQESMKGELWVVHLGGDHGKKFCPEHGIPEEEFKRKHPDTNRQRLACPECWEFLADGNREPCLRVHEVRWKREDLNSLHQIITWRLERLMEQIKDAQHQMSNPPEPEWGYDFECAKCPVRERIGCPGRESTEELEENLQGSIHELEREMATT